jgi:L-alanine-DL-glutamate epimerase-like enolase superfamily enzyme
VKIETVETTLVNLTSDGGRLPEGRLGWRDFPTLLVKVTTDDGLVGWGEAYGYGIAPSTRRCIEDLLAPMIVGSDPLDRLGIRHRLDRTFHYYGHNGPFSFGLAGIDIALWDLAGKAAGQPVHALLGGAGRREVETYASLVRYGEPALLAERCAEAVAAGYRHLKLHEAEVEVVLAAREAVGPDVELMLDTNCCWSKEEALRLAPRLAPARLRWIEDAVWPPEDWAALVELRRAGLPISAGENVPTVADFRQLFVAGAVDVAQPDSTKVGGVSVMWQVAQLADAFGVTLSPHNAGFGPGCLASLHVLAALPQPSVLERVHVRLDAWLYPELAEADHGRLPVPTGPGLGLDPDPAVVERYSA